MGEGKESWEMPSPGRDVAVLLKNSLQQYGDLHKL